MGNFGLKQILDNIGNFGPKNQNAFGRFLILN